MYTFISPTGETIKTKTVKEFADMAGMRQSNARSLACGYMTRFKGYCSSHIRAGKAKARFLTVLVNPKQGKREIVGQTVKAFAEWHRLCANEVYKIILGRRLIYRGWMLEQTHLIAQRPISAADF